VFCPSLSTWHETFQGRRQIAHEHPSRHLSTIYRCKPCNQYSPSYYPIQPVSSSPLTKLKGKTPLSSLTFQGFPLLDSVVSIALRKVTSPFSDSASQFRDLHQGESTPSYAPTPGNFDRERTGRLRETKSYRRSIYVNRLNTLGKLLKF
jgi:hypothetical protein